MNRHRVVLLPLASVLAGTVPFLLVQAPAPWLSESVSSAVQPSPETTTPSVEPSPSGADPSVSPTSPPAAFCPQTPAPYLVGEVERLRQNTIGVHYKQAVAMIGELPSAVDRQLQVRLRFIGVSGDPRETPQLPSAADLGLVVITATSAITTCLGSPSDDANSGTEAEFTLTLGAVMPEVVGMTGADAMRELGARGLDGHVSRSPPAAELSQAVRKQNPPAGTLVSFTDDVGLEFAGTTSPIPSPIPSPTADDTDEFTLPLGTTVVTAIGVAGGVLIVLLLLSLSAFLTVRGRGHRPRWVREHFRLAPGAGAGWSSGPSAEPASQDGSAGHSIRLDPHRDPGTSTIEEGEP